MKFGGSWGVGSPVVCRAEGTFTDFQWWAREHRVTSAEAKGGRPSLLSERPINSGAENTVCLPRLLCFLLQTQARGVKASLRQIIPGDCKKKKKLPLLFLNIHIHCDLDATGKRVYERIQLHINNTKGCLPAPQENAEFNLRIKYGGTPHARGPSHFVSSCVQLEPWLTSPWCKLALLPSSPAERKQRLLKKHREKALLKSLPTDVISDLRTMLFSANHPWRSPIRPFYFIWLFFYHQYK